MIDADGAAHAAPSDTAPAAPHAATHAGPSGAARTAQHGATHAAPHDVIVIMTDQQRADLCAREGFALDCTPTLDRLARGGRWFNRAYTSAPVCVPARISLLTGRYPSAHGARENQGLSLARYTRDLFGLARDAGMRTAMIGKNHSHLTPERVDDWYEFGHLGAKSPTAESDRDRAFDEWLSDLGARTATDATPHPVESQLPARLVDRAISWLDDGVEQRSLLWLSIPEPHVPYQVPEPYFSDFAPDLLPPPATGADQRPRDPLPWRAVGDLAAEVGEAEPDVLRRARASYVGMLRLVDDQIDRLIRHLDATGRLSRTLIVFVADHGDFAGEYGLMRKGPELPEVLVRIPMFFHGPGVTAEAAPSGAHVSIVDVMPTLCELLGWPLPDGVQGRSLVPILRGEAVPEREFDSAYAEQGCGGLPYTGSDTLPRRRDALRGGDSLSEATQSGSMRMVRAGRWKLTCDAVGRFALYDLDSDPYELDDLYGRPEHAQVTTRLLETLARWLVRVADPLPVPPNGYVRKLHPRNYHWTGTPSA